MTGPIAAQRLKSFIERIERLREEKKAIGSDERDVFSEAKGVGFDTKAMREVLKRRAMDAADRDEWDNLVDTYEHALGARGEAARIVRDGGTYDEAADKTGLSRATVARTVASRKNLENETLQTPEAVPAGEVEGTAESRAAQPDDLAKESCGGGESRRPAAPVGSREATDRKAWSGEPGGPKGTTNQITEPEVAPGPQDTDWDELARVQKELNDAYHARRTAA